jgi:uncharacterized UBP type Zn finger protein
MSQAFGVGGVVEEIRHYYSTRHLLVVGLAKYSSTVKDIYWYAHF